MSEEEAIEWLKALLQDKEKYAKYHSWVGTNTFVAIGTILDLYNKQQKEIIELDELYRDLLKKYNDKESVLDKIKELLEEQL